MWIRSNSGRLVRSLDTAMAGEFDPKAFKARLKEKLFTETRSMMRKIMGEITKLIKENQPAPLTGPVDLDTELPMRNREENDVTVLVDPIGGRNMGQTENAE